MASFSEVVRFLESRVNFENRNSFSVEELGRRLDALRGLLGALDHPEQAYRTVHVAGTKGKGSTCAMLESVLLEGGYRVGRFSSPHLYSITERFSVDGEPCAEAEFADRMGSLRRRVEAAAPDLAATMTYFEWTTIFAFDFFRRQNIDVAVIEVGLGGRLDATNLCRPCLTLITSIGFDHMEQLGPTLEDIAAEKGGIIKPGVPLLSTVRPDEARPVLRDLARTRNAPAFFEGEAFFCRDFDPVDDTFRFSAPVGLAPEPVDLDALRLRMPGEHQARNAALVLAAALMLKHRENLTLDERALRCGLAGAFVPARVEILESGPGAPVFVVDGAHNRSSVRAFVETVRAKFPDRRRTLIFGTALGKDVEGMFLELLPHFETILLTGHPSSPRRYPPRGLKTIADALSAATFCRPSRRPEIVVEEDSRKALADSLDRAGPDEVVCVTGSLYLAAELRALFASKQSVSR